MESQPQNPEFRKILTTFTHVTLLSGFHTSYLFLFLEKTHILMHTVYTISDAP